jgi:hypothetical protein
MFRVVCAFSADGGIGVIAAFRHVPLEPEPRHNRLDGPDHLCLNPGVGATRRDSRRTVLSNTTSKVVAQIVHAVLQPLLIEDRLSPVRHPLRLNVGLPADLHGCEYLLARRRDGLRARRSADHCQQEKCVLLQSCSPNCS